MQLTKVHVENYKGLRDVEVPLSPFVCLIGENSAGKSSVLLALSLFLSGTSMPKTNYFDEGRDVRIAVDLAEIGDEDLGRLAEAHRDKIRGIVREGSLTLVRIYGADGKSILKYRKLSPTDPRFSDSQIDNLLKGKRAGKPLADAVVACFPELEGTATSATSPSEMRAAIEQLAERLPDEQKAVVDAELPTGIDRSISAMLPERIYVPAVKDLRDDVKTTESTPFGKILSILLAAIEPELGDERNLFETLNAKLNRVGEDAADRRLEPVKTIEKTVERFVQESFSNVTLRIEIPPPELRAVLSSAVINANDGVDGEMDTKGDGLRRAIVFAVIRSYVELNRAGVNPAVAGPTGADPGYLLLFEEPELYLHPKAQEQLFEALRVFSRKHRVVVSTHSPLFFGPRATTTFVKMRKRADPAVARKPFGTAHHVDLTGTTEKDQFQIICYENNNIAFFSDEVVLVEGDSDYIALPHLARLVDPAWDCRQRGLAFARISGKGSIRRYRDFFRRFKMRISVITDCDFLLGAEFSQVVTSLEIRAQRQRLIAAIDGYIAGLTSNPDAGARQVLRAEANAEVRRAWRDAGKVALRHRAGEATAAEKDEALNRAVAAEDEWARGDILKSCRDPNLLGEKRRLLEMLRAEGVYVLERGTIEDYYPPGVTGNGKPARAQSFCNLIGTREQALALCDGDHRGTDGSTVSELEAIFGSIFGQNATGL